MFRLVYRNLPLSNFIFRFHPRQHSFALVWSLFYLYSGISVSKISYNPFPWLYRTRTTNPLLNLNWKMSNIERDQRNAKTFLPFELWLLYHALSSQIKLSIQRWQPLPSNQKTEVAILLIQSESPIVRSKLKKLYLRIQPLNQYFESCNPNQSINESTRSLQSICSICQTISQLINPSNPICSIQSI